MRSAAAIKSHPLHPMLIAFPIGLLVTSFIFDVLGVALPQPRLWAAAWYMIVGGIVSGLLAAVPGVMDLLRVIPPNSSGKRRGWIHGGLNVTVVLLFIAIAAYRGGPDAEPDKLALLLSACGVAGLGVSGWLGGTLVYRNQIGVDRRYAQAAKLRERDIPDFSRPALNQSELADGQIMLVRVGDERIAVGRCGEGIAAWSDHCTHKGGPLADGSLIGCTVQCPWHGSQFDVRSGRVVAGPAEEKIETYNVEVRGGQVYLQPKRSSGDKREQDKDRAA